MNIHQYSSAKPSTQKKELSHTLVAKIQGKIIVANQDDDKIKSKDAAVMDKNKTNSKDNT